RDQELAAIRQPHATDQRVERDEECVRRNRLISGQSVEERRLSRVRIADQGHRWHGRLVTPFPGLSTPPAYRIDLLRDHADAVPDAPPVSLELRLAGAAGADATAEPGQGVARAHEPRHQVLELRQLDLELPFFRLGASGEDIEDQL